MSDTSKEEIADKFRKKLAPQLKKSGILTPENEFSFHVLCQTFADLQLAEGKLQVELKRVYLAYAKEFGLTPASRKKMNTTEAPATAAPRLPLD